MRQMTEAQFEAFVARTDWQREQTVEYVERSEVVRQLEEYDSETDELNQIDIRGAWGYAVVESTLDGVTIRYNEGWQYDLNQPDTFATSTEGLDVWEIEGVEIVDEDGDPLTRSANWECHLTDAFSRIDYSSITDSIEQIEDVDTDEETDMDSEKIIIERDNEPSLRFAGELIASASSSDDKAMGSSYSGQTGRWTTLKLYKTAGGKFVCQQIGHTRWQGEKTRYSAAVCSTAAEVIAFFGHRWLAQELYSEAGIEDVQDIE